MTPKDEAGLVFPSKAMTADTPELTPRFERFTVTYPSGTVIESYYCGGATLREVEVSHPMAVVEAVEEGA